MNISLTPQLRALIKAKVDTGMYNNASEVVREALRLLNEQDKLKALKKEVLKQEIAIGVASLEKGDSTSISISTIANNVLKSKKLK